MIQKGEILFTKGDTDKEKASSQSTLKNSLVRVHTMSKKRQELKKKILTNESMCWRGIMEVRKGSNVGLFKNA